ncbi:hypothetical protein B0H14DRAFT_2580806 [Mycena olivaceomarginata]|nr:hypothetical protein B0H14DRAFT_2580806 [Mycena olivaceomarginata]
MSAKSRHSARGRRLSQERVGQCGRPRPAAAAAACCVSASAVIKPLDIGGRPPPAVAQVGRGWRLRRQLELRSFAAAAAADHAAILKTQTFTFFSATVAFNSIRTHL